MAGEDEQNEENRTPGAAGGAGANPPPTTPTSLTLAPEVISALVAPVAFKLPEFWPQSTDLWFARAVSYTHLRAHETDSYLVCRLLLERRIRVFRGTDQDGQALVGGFVVQHRNHVIKFGLFHSNSLQTELGISSCKP